MSNRKIAVKVNGITRFYFHRKLLLSSSALTVGVGLLTGLIHAQIVHAQTKTGVAWGQTNPLLNSIAGKLTLKADIGYLQNFVTDWTDGNDHNFISKANGTVGYGASLGWTHTSGFGLSTEYLGFINNWQDQNENYTANYHVVTFTPSYRFAFGDDNAWGLKLGLGLGFSISDIHWNIGGGVAESATYSNSGNLSGNVVTANNSKPIKTTQAATYVFSLNNQTTLSAPATGNCLMAGVEYIYDRLGNGTISNSCVVNGISNGVASDNNGWGDVGLGEYLMDNPVWYVYAGVNAKIAHGVWNYLLEQAVSGDNVKKIKALNALKRLDSHTVDRTNGRLVAPLYDSDKKRYFNNTSFTEPGDGAIKILNLTFSVFRNFNLSTRQQEALLAAKLRLYADSSNITGNGWQNLSRYGMVAELFRDWYSATSDKSIHQLKTNEVAFIAQESLAAANNNTNTIDTTLKGNGIIYYGNVNKDDIGDKLGWKTYLSDITKINNFNHLYDMATATNMEKLAVGEVLYLKKDILTNVTGVNAIDKKTALNKLKTEGSYIFYDQITATDWQEVLSSNHIIAINNMFGGNDSGVAYDGEIYKNTKKLSGSEVLWVADAMWQGQTIVKDANNANIANLTDSLKKNKFNLLRADENGGNNNGGHLFFGNVPKLGNNGWRIWLEDANKAKEINNLITAATPVNMEKLVADETVVVKWQNWTGLNRGSAANNQNLINALRGGTAAAPLGVFLFEKVAKGDWIDMIQDVQKAIVFQNLFINAEANNFEQLTSADDVVHVPYEVWSLVGKDNINKLVDSVATAAAKISYGAVSAVSGAAKDDAGFVIAPTIAIEYDNGLLHADLNFRYIHALKNVKYNGVGGVSNDRYQLAGPLAMFIGAGFGINF